jgi:hypothetical protein
MVLVSSAQRLLAESNPLLKIEAPWTKEQVDALNSYQEEGWMHPFTCGSGNRTDKYHLDGEGKLVATENGWICPFCPYRQTWAWDMMFKPRPW